MKKGKTKKRPIRPKIITKAITSILEPPQSGPKYISFNYGYHNP